MLDLPQRFTFRNQSVAWGNIGDGPPVVMIHGTPFSSQVWRRIARYIAAHKRVYFFDLLGYGQSEMAEGQDVSLAVQNELLAALVAHWGIEEPEIVCHDFGGTTALRGHYLNGLTYSQLTLIDPVALSPWGTAYARHVRHHEDAMAGLPGFAHEHLTRAYLATASYAGLSAEASDIYLKPWLGEVGQAGLYRQIAQFDQKYTDDVQPSYGPMPFPTQVLWGEQDGWLPLSQGQELAGLVAGGALTVVPNAGHLVQEDAPEAIVAALL